MKKSTSLTSNVIAILLTAAIIVLAWQVVLPGYFNHKSSLTNLSTEVDAAKSKLASIDKAKIDLAQIKSTADQVLVAIPQGPDDPNLISELESIAVKNQIVIPSINIEPSEADTGGATSLQTTTSSASSTNAPATATTTSSDQGTSATTNEESATAGTSAKPVTISFSVNGSFEELSSFIGALENSVRFMNIVSLSFAKATEGSGNTLSLQIQAYQQ